MSQPFTDLNIISNIQSLEHDQLFNLIEAIFWIVISLIFCIQIFRLKANQDLAIASTITFFAFGISDLIEIQTRAWYQPVSLFIFKAACVLALLIIFCIYKKRIKKSNVEH